MVNFSVSKLHCVVSKIIYSSLQLVFIDNSFFWFSLFPPQAPIFWLCDLSLIDWAFSSLFSSTRCPPISPLWVLIDISLLTLSFTLTLMCAALSDAQVVWSFICPHSLLFSFLPGYSSLLPVLWKSTFPLQNPLHSYLGDPATPQSSQQPRGENGDRCSLETVGPKTECACMSVCVLSGLGVWCH